MRGASTRNRGGIRLRESGNTWTQQAELTASDGAASDDFGYSVAVSGTTAVVGAWGRHSATGAAYVFGESANTWTQQAELTASDGAASDDFGYSVAVSGTTAVVGAYGNHKKSGTSPGGVAALVHAVGNDVDRAA